REMREKETEDVEVQLGEPWAQIQEAVEEEEPPRLELEVSLPLSQTNREATHIETGHPTVSDQVASSQLAHLHTPPSHSTISQQMVVSVSHGDVAQLPPATHLESAGVEIREDLPHLSTSLVAHRVVEPLPGTFSIPSIFRSRSMVPQAEIPRES